MGDQMHIFFGAMIFLTVVYTAIYIAYQPISRHRPPTYHKYLLAGLLYIVSSVIGFFAKSWHGINNPTVLALIFIAGIMLLAISFKKK
jgi:small-conductance mechanosensitive channel